MYREKIGVKTFKTTRWLKRERKKLKKKQTGGERHKNTKKERGIHTTEQ